MTAWTGKASSSWWPGNGGTTAYPCDGYCYNKVEDHQADYVVVRLEDADDGQGYQPYWRDYGATNTHYACFIVEF
ncbi:MAG: hypothetical protein FIB01_14400 [Gemmatimonadetes bacterium]|nr:hypothetical protein [Gemmatimonadota bacterium]